MLPDANPRLRALTQTTLRIAAGLAFFVHGTQKLFGWFGGFTHGEAAELMSRYGVAGVIETVAGAGIVVGLFTRSLATLAVAEMAVAYFWIHVGGNAKLLWWQNHGELPILYASIWLFFAVWGPGPHSIDAGLRASREDAK